MHHRTSLLSAAAVAMLALAGAGPAAASLVFDATLLAPSQGFGNAPRDLTLHATGNDTFESGGVGVNSTGTIVFGNVIPDGVVFMGNGVSNEPGLSALPNPRADNQKYGIPSVGSLGITEASQIAVLFNATEPGGNAITVADLTLKFYSPTGMLLGAIDGQQEFMSTNPGNGVAGFTFVVDAAQQAYVNGLLASGPDTLMALEATLTGYSGGPESFLIFNRDVLPAIPEPASAALLLAGLSVLGVGVKRRRARA